MSASRPHPGVRHVTVVPANYSPEDDDVNDANGTDRE